MDLAGNTGTLLSELTTIHHAKFYDILIDNHKKLRS